MLKHLSKIEPTLFYALLALWMLPVWSVDFFVTGDGPCHLYNSKILLDWWQSGSREFYKPFYFLNTNFDPNWLFNLLTAPLLAVFGSGLSEKFFFTMYVLGFGLGFRYLISQINPAAKFISTLGLLFCYHKLLMMGFLNNSLSLALWFWAVGWWWSKRDDHRPVTLLKTALLLLLLFSAHPMGFTYSGMMMGAMLTGLLFFDVREQGWRASLGLFFSRAKSLLLSALPALVLFAEFVLRREWSAEKVAPDMKGILESVARLTSLRTMNSTERDLATATAVVCVVFFLSAIVLRLRERRWLPADGLLLFLGLAFFSILNPPSSLSGGLEVSLRMGMIPYFAMLCWASTAQFPVWSKVAGQLAALVLALGFLAARLPIHRNASDYAEEIRSCAPYLKDRATLLTLNYDWTGHTPEGKEIANGIWLFTHVDCYLGTDRSMVISDNYETHFWYFPIIVRWQTDMYTQTDKDGINFDHRPPRADILSYKRRTGQELDFVLLLSYRDEFKDHEYTKEIFAQLEQGYDRAFVSEFGHAMLYKRRGL
ncbi:MAG: hypothetical protein ACKVUS_05140 [Saprospiraceae bacterium]